MFCCLRNHNCEGCLANNCKSFRQITRGDGFTYIVCGKSASSSIIKAINKEYVFVPFDELCSEEGFIFSFVRNPFDRLYSCWAGWTKRDRSPLYRLDSRIKRGISLEEFVNVVCSIEDDMADEHFVSQSALLTNQDGKLMPDFIGRVESMKEDWKIVMEKTNINSPIGHHGRVASVTHYADTFSPKMKSMLKERYAEDFERWY
jgi:hypothetical protein